MRSSISVDESYRHGDFGEKPEINIFYRQSYLKHCAIFFLISSAHLFLDTFKKGAGDSFKMPNLAHVHTAQTFLCAIYEHITRFPRNPNMFVVKNITYKLLLCCIRVILIVFPIKQLYTYITLTCEFFKGQMS